MKSVEAVALGIRYVFLSLHFSTFSHSLGRKRKKGGRVEEEVEKRRIARQRVEVLKQPISFLHIQLWPHHPFPGQGMGRAANGILSDGGGETELNMLPQYPKVLGQPCWPEQMLQSNPPPEKMKYA